MERGLAEGARGSAEYKGGGAVADPPGVGDDADARDAVDAAVGVVVVQRNVKKSVEM